jgi:uncharacterized membrane-anchored protein YhcB (DUF1043 family)
MRLYFIEAVKVRAGHGRYRTGMHTKEMQKFRRNLREETRSAFRHFREISDLLKKLEGRN